METITLDFSTNPISLEQIQLLAVYQLGYKDLIQDGFNDVEEIIDTGIPIPDESTGKDTLDKDGKIVTYKTKNIRQEPIMIPNTESIEKFCERIYKERFNSMIRMDFVEATKKLTQEEIKDFNIIK